MELERIAALSFFVGLPEHELAAVAQRAREHTFEAGETLMREGDFGHSLFIIEDGSAEIRIDGEIVASVGPGDVVGEVAVLASGRRTATVVGTSEVRALMLFKRDVWALADDAPQAARRLRTTIDERVDPAAD